MTHCIKTGARVYLADYDVILPADVFSVGDDTLVFRFNMALFHNRSHDPFSQKDITHTVHLEALESLHFWREDLGILVIDKRLVTLPANSEELP